MTTTDAKRSARAQHRMDPDWKPGNVFRCGCGCQFNSPDEWGDHLWAVARDAIVAAVCTMVRATVEIEGI